MISERIENAINVFLDAINNGTLAKGTCTACAVGNLVSERLGIKSEIKCTFNRNNFNLPYENTHWMTPISGLSDGDLEEGIRQCNLTDFSIEELKIIEKTFENNTYINYTNYENYSKEEIRADQIKGLEAVVAVMLTFDESKEDVKEVFTNRAELIPIN